MSSPGSGGSTTTTQELPDWAQPYAQQLLQRSADLSNTTQPAYTGQTVAGLNDTQTGAIGGLSNAAGSQAGTANAATAYYNSLIGQPNGMSISNPFSGNVTAANASAVNANAAPNVTASTAADAFANPANNPYLASTVQAANNDLTTAYNNTTGASTLAQFRNAGAFGGSAQQQQTTANQKQLADQVSQQTSGMYNQAYNTAAGVASQNAAQQNAVGLANQSQANNIGLANQSAQNNVSLANQAAQNNVALANQSVGTSANQAYNQQASSNYYNQQGAIAAGLNGATAANSAASSLYGNQYTGGAAQQTTSQDQLNALYQQWLQQTNQPYSQLSTLSSGLSGALGSGTGITTQQSSSGSGSSLAQLLGLGAAGAGIYSSFK